MGLFGYCSISRDSGGRAPPPSLPLTPGAGAAFLSSPLHSHAGSRRRESRPALWPVWKCPQVLEFKTMARISTPRITWTCKYRENSGAGLFSRGRSSFWWKYCAYIPPLLYWHRVVSLGLCFVSFPQRLPSSRCVVSPRVCRGERWRLVAPTKGSRGKPCGRRTCREISTYLGVRWCV